MKKKAAAHKKGAHAGAKGIAARRRELAKRLWRAAGEDLSGVEAFADLLEYVKRSGVTRAG